MTEEQIHHDRKDSNVVFLCLISIYKKTKRRPGTINFREEGFERERIRIRIFHKTSWQNHHGFETSCFG
jgi:hypothetical protein